MSISTKDYLVSVEVVNSSNYVLTDPQTFTADGSLAVITLGEVFVRDVMTSLFGSNPDFSIPGAWEKVVVTASPSGNDQFKALVFTNRDGVWKCFTSWNSYQYKGTWEIQHIYVVSKTGNYAKVSGDVIPSTEDLTVS
jgi:hypothetical protein